MISHLSLGINISIIAILLIFGALFWLPLKMLLETNYQTYCGESDKISSVIRDEIIEANPVDFRSLKLCESLNYESIIKSLYYSNYDKNCALPKSPSRTKKLPSSHDRLNNSKLRIFAQNVAEMIGRGFVEETPENTTSVYQNKSMYIAGHILAVMLIASAVAALVEVLRARLSAAIKVKPAPGDSGPGEHVRTYSFADLAQRRNFKRDTIQAQKSFEIQGMMHRSPVRLLAARPPPLLRRSSFPAHCLSNIRKDVALPQPAIGRLSRRPSFILDSEEDLNGQTDFRRHSRLIRRH
ncbi:uncharacterized protein LOC105683494 [Athalia rosae]|uniref:uncharacterized protein LOC105683494 n=1 Tax=Athalia rosae TaxID=37344 RepID=UPI0020340C6A|nr:uncharacterized protein LOC105683494 [Athalia rosae]